MRNRKPAFEHLPTQDALITERVRSEDIGSAGVSDRLRALLDEKDAKVAKRVATDFVLNGTEFFDLVRNCATVGFQHDEGHWHDMPADRALTSDEKVEMFKSRGQLSPKLAGRIRDGFREREHFSWHTFARGNEWHCFFYSNRDVAGEPLTGEQHWTEGPHVHYASHLLIGGMKREDFVAQLQPATRHPRSLHMRFESGFTKEDWDEFEREM